MNTCPDCVCLFSFVFKLIGVQKKLVWLLIYDFFSDFPKFWLDLEAELGEYAEDLIQVKSVYTILGFSTKQSVASMETTRKNFL